MNWPMFAAFFLAGVLLMSIALWWMGNKYAFLLWQLLCVAVLGVPMMLVGYFGTFVVNGILTGYRLHQLWHKSSP